MGNPERWVPVVKPRLCYARRVARVAAAHVAKRTVNRLCGIVA